MQPTVHFSKMSHLKFSIRRLAALIPGKTRHNNTFFCTKQIRKESSLNNVLSSSLSFSSPPARKVKHEGQRAPRAGHLPREGAIFII